MIPSTEGPTFEPQSATTAGPPSSAPADSASEQGIREVPEISRIEVTQRRSRQLARKIGDLFGVVAPRLIPAVDGLMPRGKIAVLITVLIIVTASTTVSYVYSFGLDLVTAKQRISAEDEVAQKIDLEKLPFTANIDHPTYSGGEMFGLDRPLTEAEQASLAAIEPDEEAGENVWDLIRPLGGYVMPPPPPIDLGLKFSDPRSWRLHYTEFFLNIFSDRKSPLTITGMQAVNVSCRPPSAKTVIHPTAFGGSDSYDGVVFNLEDPPSFPIIMDENSDQGQPYFSRRKIDLGQGITPGSLRVAALVSNRTCEWEISARYRDSTKASGEVTLKDGDKSFLARGLPTDPEQYWTFDYEGKLHPCHKIPDEDLCPIL